MDVDHRADVGPEAQDLPVQVVADAGHRLADQQPAGRDIGHHDVVEGHLFERDLGVLGVGDAVREAGRANPDRHVAEGVVDIAPPGDHPGIAEKQLTGCPVERHIGCHGDLPSRAPPPVSAAATQ